MAPTRRKRSATRAEGVERPSVVRPRPRIDEVVRVGRVHHAEAEVGHPEEAVIHELGGDALTVQLGEAHVGIPRALPALGAVHAVGVEHVERRHHHRVVQRVHRPTVDLVVGPECRQVLVEAPLEVVGPELGRKDRMAVGGDDAHLAHSLSPS